MSEANLISLVYVSSAVRILPEQEIVDILRISRDNNSQVGITGMLLYKDGNFMQVLEGPNDQIATLVRRVEKDPRHHGILTLINKPISTRSFGGWSMAFQNLDTLDARKEEAWSPFLATSLLDERFRSQPEACYKLLLSFKDKMR